MHPTKKNTALDAIKENFSRRRDIQGELRQIDEAADSDKRDYNDTEKVRIEELRSELGTVDERVSSMLEIEARGAHIESSAAELLGVYLERDSGDLVDHRSIGARFTADDGYTSWVNGGARGQFGVDFPGVEARAVTDTSTGATSGGAFIVPEMLGRVATKYLDRRTFLLDLLPTIPVSSGSVEYVSDDSPLADLADKAVEVTEGSAKPQAGITTSLQVEPIATIASWVNITRQVAADMPQIQGYLDTRLRYSLKRRTDAQAINGNGTLPNLKGLLNRSNIVTYAPATAEARATSIRHAITLMEQAEAVPEVVALNPADAELFDLTNAAVAGLHSVPNLADGPARTAWGLTQVHSNAIPAGTAMLLDPMAVAVLDRLQPSAFMTDSHASNFTSNILTLLLELRVGLALFAPSGVCKVTFNGTA